MRIKKVHTYTIMGCVLVGLTVFGKIAALYGTDILSQLGELCWIAVAIFLIATLRGRVQAPRRLRILIFIAVVLFLFENINTIRYGYLQSGLYRGIVTVSALYWVMYILICGNLRRMNVYLKIYTTASAVLGVCAILVSGVSFNEWMNSDVYLFGGLGEKNAVGQILGMAILVECFKNNECTKLKESIVKYVKIVLNFAGLLFVQCRTAILALAILWILHLIIFKENRRIKIFFTIVAVMISNMAGLTDIISKSLFIEKYAGQGGTAFTSGRLDLWKAALDIVNNHIILGYGNYYVDNAYINALANYGIIFGVIYIFAIVYCFFENIKNARCTNQVPLVIMSTLFMLIVTSFEAIPPFGPSISVLCFWMISAYVDACKCEKL